MENIQFTHKAAGWRVGFLPAAQNRPSVSSMFMPPSAHSKVFGALKLNVNEFKQINNSWGHSCTWMLQVLHQNICFVFSVLFPLKHCQQQLSGSTDPSHRCIMLYLIISTHDGHCQTHRRNCSDMTPEILWFLGQKIKINKNVLFFSGALTSINTETGQLSDKSRTADLWTQNKSQVLYKQPVLLINSWHC